MKKCRIKDAFKKMVATLLVLAMCVGMHPFRAEAEGEEQITLTYDGFYTQGGYRIGLNVNFLDGDGIIDFSTKRSMWIVDGVEKEMTPSVVYYTKMSETSLQLLIPYAEIQPGVPNGYAVGTHWFSIPAGTVIGNMITTNTISFRINAAEVTPLIETSVSCTEYGTEGGSNQRYRFTLDVPGLPNSSYEKKEGVFHSTDIIVDGNSKSGVTYYRPDASANSTAMNLYVPYALIEDNITTSTAIQKEHLLTIKKGTW